MARLLVKFMMILIYYFSLRHMSVGSTRGVAKEHLNMSIIEEYKRILNGYFEK